MRGKVSKMLRKANASNTHRDYKDSKWFWNKLSHKEKGLHSFNLKQVFMKG